MEIKEIVGAVLQEIDDIITKKHKDFNTNSVDKWIEIVGEEYGEICRALNDKEGKNFITESIQTMAGITLMIKQYLKEHPELVEKK